MEPNRTVEQTTPLTCPYCRKTFRRDQTTAMPFCSQRCKQIDLGLWLNEAHGIPYESDPEDYQYE